MTRIEVKLDALTPMPVRAFLKAHQGISNTIWKRIKNSGTFAINGTICNATQANVKNGDIITFKLGADDVATHRAVSVGNEGIHTKGDANENEDAVIVTEELFVGKTIWHIPEVGYLITVLRSRNGLIMTAAFIVFFLLVGRLLESLRDNAEKESESKKNE